MISSFTSLNAHRFNVRKHCYTHCYTLLSQNRNEIMKDIISWPTVGIYNMFEYFLFFLFFSCFVSIRFFSFFFWFSQHINHTAFSVWLKWMLKQNKRKKGELKSEQKINIARCKDRHIFVRERKKKTKIDFAITFITFLMWIKSIKKCI